MRIAVTRETFPGERRVALVPAQIPALTKAALEVVVETGAGVEAGFPDAAYAEKGARIAACWSAGTPPRNTSVSVPRLTPERTVRTSTSPGPGSGTSTGRISPTPGSLSQNALACTAITSPSSCRQGRVAAGG